MKVLTKKAFALLLSFVMVFTMMPTAAFATSVENSGKTVVSDGESRIEAEAYDAKYEPDSVDTWEGITTAKPLGTESGGTGTAVNWFCGDRTLTYQIEAETEGWYHLAFHYANGTGQPSRVGITVNKAPELLKVLPATTAWTDYTTGDVGKVYLESGANTITIRALGSPLLSAVGGLNFDYFTLLPVDDGETVPAYTNYTVEHVLYTEDYSEEIETVRETYRGIAGEETNVPAYIRAEGWWPLSFSQKEIAADGTTVVRIPYLSGNSAVIENGVAFGPQNTLTLDHVPDQTGFKYEPVTIDGITYNVRSSFFGSATTFEFEAPYSGEYYLSYPYAQNGATGGVMSIDVNGSVVAGDKEHPSTGSWSVYNTSMFTPISVKKGTNTITLTTAGIKSSDSINIPYLRLIPIFVGGDGDVMPYTVEYRARTGEDTSELIETATLFGLSGEQTQAVGKAIEGYQQDGIISQVTIQQNPTEGENVVKVYYLAKDVTMTFDAATDGGTLDGGGTTKTVTGKSGAQIAAEDIPKVIPPDGEIFLGWSEKETVFKTKNITNYAIFTPESAISNLSTVCDIKATLGTQAFACKESEQSTAEAKSASFGGTVYYAIKAPADGRYLINLTSPSGACYEKNQSLKVAIDNEELSIGGLKFAHAGAVFELQEGIHLLKIHVDYEALYWANIVVTSLDAPKGFDGMYVKADSEAGLPADIQLMKNGEERYELYLPGGTDVEKIALSWNIEDGLTVKDSEGTEVTSGNAPVAAPGETAIYTVTRGDGTTETYNITTYAGSETVESMFIDIDDQISGNFVDFTTMNSDPAHEMEAAGIMAVSGEENNYFVSMKGRGNATWGKEKNPYNITVYEDATYDGKSAVELIDGVSSKKWSLLANYADSSLMRNKIAFDMANTMGIGLGSQYVDLWVDGTYLGNYLMTPKNDYQAPKSGYALELDNYKDDEDDNFTLNGLNEFGTSGAAFNRFTVKENKSSATTLQIKSYMQKAWDAMLDESSEDYQNYIDVESWAKMYLLQEFNKSFDVVSGSILMHRDGLDTEDKIVAGPLWDMDNALGRTSTNDKLGNNVNQHTGDGWYISNVSNETVTTFWLQQLGKHESFMKKVYEVYAEYEDMFNSVGVTIDTISEDLQDSAAMNFVRWNVNQTNYNNASVTEADGDGCVVTTNWADYVANLKNYAVARAAFLKNNTLVLTFDANGGSFAEGETGTRTGWRGTAIDMPAAPTLTGYDFAGWYTDEDLTQAFEDTTIQSTKTVYAKWTIKDYTITYAGVEGAVNNNPATYTIESADITLAAPTKAGYVFTGWTYEGQTTPVMTVIIAKGSTGDKAYTANWKEEEKPAPTPTPTPTPEAGTVQPPAATSKVTTALYGYDDIKVTWKAVAGATSYKVYMKKGSGKYKLVKTTSSLSYKAKNLADGAKYTFKVVAYNGTLAGGEKASSAIYTLKKVTGVKVVKSGSKVKVSWKNIEGETGYQISKMTKKTGTQKKPTTYKTTKGKYKKLAAAKGKTYYYKVRAYKQVGKTKIYGPWSAVKKFKRK